MCLCGDYFWGECSRWQESEMRNGMENGKTRGTWRSLRRYAKQLQCVRVAKKFHKSGGANWLSHIHAHTHMQLKKDTEGTLVDRRQEVRKMPQLTTALCCQCAKEFWPLKLSLSRLISLRCSLVSLHLLFCRLGQQLLKLLHVWSL